MEVIRLSLKAGTLMQSSSISMDADLVNYPSKMPKYNVLYRDTVSFKCKNIPLFDLKLPSKLLNKFKLLKLAFEGVKIVDFKNTWISKETEIKKGTVIYPGCYIQGANKIGERNFIGPNTVISGNVITGDDVKILQSNVSNATLGNGVTVGPYALVKNEVKVGENSRIGTFVEVEKAEIGSNTKISHQSYVGNAEIGDNINIGGHFGTSNYDPRTKIKSKTIIKDDAMIGGNVVIQAPVTIGEGAMVASKTLVTQDVPDHFMAIGRTRQANKNI